MNDKRATNKQHRKYRAFQICSINAMAGLGGIGKSGLGNLAFGQSEAKDCCIERTNWLLPLPEAASLKDYREITEKT